MPVQALRLCLSQMGVGADATLLLACSGGRDSQVLMHAAAALPPGPRFVVAHVQHGLQPGADDWLAFCAAEAAALGLDFRFRRLRPPGLPGRQPAGLEAWAREWRYRALAEMALEVGAQVVLTAHHANDQLETVEIRRRRGTGILGLGGMRARAPMPHAPAGLWLLRPFLNISRAELQGWAQAQGLRWVDDPSNQDLRFTRNRVRSQLDARLASGEQSLPAELAAIGLFQQAADELQRQAEQDLAACSLHLLPTAAGDEEAGGAAAVLSRAALLKLPAERRAEALRCWLRGQGCRMPSQAKLAELERQMVFAAAAQATVRHDGRVLLRYRDRIAPMPTPAPIVPLHFRWNGELLLDVPAGRLYFDCHPVGHDAPAAWALAPDWLREQRLWLDQGRGRDRLRERPGAHSRSWKNRMQEQGVPPSLRSSLPVLRAGDALLFAAPFGMMLPADSAARVQQPDHPGIVLRWVAREDIRSWL